MNINKFNKWLIEAEDNRRNVYLLVGPPAVGKTNWINKNLSNDSIVVSKDNIIEDKIFPKYKLANKDIFELPPESSETGQYIPGKEKLGKVSTIKRFSRSKNKEVEEKVYEQAYKAGEELNSLYEKQLQDAISSGKKNIVIDAIHMRKSTRSASMEKFKDKSQFKIVAVVFPHEGYEVQIKNSADARAKDFLDRFEGDFDRGVTWSNYQKMYGEYEKPSTQEGIDEIVDTPSRFSKTDRELGLDRAELSETLVQKTREFLHESEKLSKYWKARMHSRIKRAKREPKNKIDREWAETQQQKSKDLNNKVYKYFDKEIEMTEELSEEIDSFIEEIKKKRAERKKQLEEKAKFKSPKDSRSKKTLPNPYKDAKVTDKFPFSKDRTGGVSKVYRKRSKNAGGPTAAPGEAIGPGE